ncbi:MAG: hypothetical protein DWP94_02110 [Flavobacterium sp.]|nr:MAG: hypothetical protein DWP94_02110 [Flavobacterium sp.]
MKIEDNIREKLQERELQPSAAAWEKLDARLGNTGRPKKNRTTWFAIAAGFTGLLILAAIFLNNNGIASGNELVEDSSVEMPKTGPEDDSNEFIAVPDDSQGEIASEEIKIDKPVNKETPKIKKNETKKDFLAKVDRTTVNNAVVTNETKKKISEENELKPEQPMTNEDFMQNKVNEVVAEVENRAKANNTVSPEEIDELLKQAQRQISKQRILNSQSNKVDAAALLEDVEFELERSFRDKVFDALGDGYKKIRTAVAERNN